MKLPWFKFYPEKWISDTELSQCSLAAHGLWIVLISHMHISGMKGELTANISSLARSCRCSDSELLTLLDELKNTGTADVLLRVTNDNTTVTVINRRMKREDKVRQDAALRAKKHREKQKSNGESAVQNKEVRSKKKKLDNTNTMNNTNVLFKSKSETDFDAGSPLKVEKIDLKKKYREIQISLNGADPKDIYLAVKNFIQTYKPSFALPYIDAWNLIAPKIGLSGVRGPTDKRENKIRIRTSEKAFDFYEIMEILRKDKFSRGDNDRGWTVSFDYIIDNQTNYNKILDKKPNEPKTAY